MNTLSSRNSKSFAVKTPWTASACWVSGVQGRDLLVNQSDADKVDALAGEIALLLGCVVTVVVVGIPTATRCWLVMLAVVCDGLLWSFLRLRQQQQ